MLLVQRPAVAKSVAEWPAVLPVQRPAVAEFAAAAAPDAELRLLAHSETTCSAILKSSPVRG